MFAPRFSFESAGDKLLAAGRSVKITLSRWPGNGESAIDCEFELSGSVPLTNDGAAELLASLVAEFRAPRSPEAEGGAV